MRDRMTFARILCPTDFSDGSQQALRVAARIASKTNAELVVAHVWYVPPMAFAGERAFMPPLVQDLADEAQQDLDIAVCEASSPGAKPVVGKMLSGVPWAQIVSLLEQDTYDLCVIGTHGRTGLARILLGSVAEKVVRHAPCSVLAVRSDREREQFEHALVPTDFSTSAEYALQLAAEVVSPAGLITLLYALELPGAYGSEVPDLDFRRDLDMRATVALEQAAAAVDGKPRLVTAARTGAPGAQILAALDEDPSIDLVVMGSHGRTGIKRAVIGSVAEKVVRYARCPVLVARRREST